MSDRIYNGNSHIALRGLRYAKPPTTTRDEVGTLQITRVTAQHTPSISFVDLFSHFR